MVHQLQFDNREDKVAHLEGLERIPSINPKDYLLTGNYQRLDFIKHTEFGTGFVEEIIDRKTIRVFFLSGEQILTQREFVN